MSHNLYQAYISNLKTIINKYPYKYHWFFIDEYKFFNVTSWKANDFNFPDKFLTKYKNEKIKLGQDILEKGTYSPFFYWEDGQGKKHLLLGKHRLYSLLLCNQQEKIKRKFLFIEYPGDPYDISMHEPFSEPCDAKLYYFDDNQNLYQTQPKSIYEINDILLLTGDGLSSYFFDNNIQPDERINNEQLFQEFLLS